MHVEDVIEGASVACVHAPSEQHRRCDLFGSSQGQSVVLVRHGLAGLIHVPRPSEAFLGGRDPLHHT